MSQEGDVGDFFPYPPELGPNVGIALERIPSKAVYRTQDDRGHVTITVDALRLTCDADGTLRCDERQSGRTFVISQGF